MSSSSKQPKIHPRRDEAARAGSYMWRLHQWRCKSQVHQITRTQHNLWKVNSSGSSWITSFYLLPWETGFHCPQIWCGQIKRSWCLRFQEEELQNFTTSLHAGFCCKEETFEEPQIRYCEQQELLLIEMDAEMRQQHECTSSVCFKRADEWDIDCHKILIQSRKFIFTNHSTQNDTITSTNSNCASTEHP